MIQNDLSLLVGCNLRNATSKIIDSFFESKPIEVLQSLIKNENFVNCWQYDKKSNMVKITGLNETGKNFEYQFRFDSLNLYNICKGFSKIPYVKNNSLRKTDIKKPTNLANIKGLKFKFTNYLNVKNYQIISSINFDETGKNKGIVNFDFNNDENEINVLNAVKKVCQNYNWLVNYETIESYKDKFYSELKELFDLTKQGPVFLKKVSIIETFKQDVKNEFSQKTIDLYKENQKVIESIQNEIKQAEKLKNELKDDARNQLRNHLTTMKKESIAEFSY